VLQNEKQPERKKRPSLGVAMIPLVAMGLLLGVGFGVYRIHPQILLVAAAFVTACLGVFLGLSWREMEEGILSTINRAMPAILILLSVGILIGAWIACGTIPMIIYYGLETISPRYFLFTTCLVCSIASLATGTAWGTIGTLGVAFMGIATGLEVPLEQTAGAIVGGAYFGDKMSPFSDVANLAPVAAGSNLFDHLKHMLWSATPAWLFGLIIYFFVGLRYETVEIESESVRLITETLEQSFRFHPLLWLPILIVFYLAVTKRPTIPSMMISSLIAGILAVVFQGASIQGVATAMNSGYVGQTGVESVDALISRGGLTSMLDAFLIAFTAFCFGGIMQKTGVLAVLLERLTRFANRVWRLVLITIGSAFSTALITGNPYLAMLIPGELLSPIYIKMGLAAKNLSRLVEESGAILIPLIPWSMGGVYCAGVFGVPTLSYLPWSIMNYTSVIVLVIYGITGFTMAPRINDDETQIGS
jgi:NhaC family Na+:H+ antiporter